ncbi:hypothetical protein JHK87_044504 [Glycine soja]|nr:hypothetical protein JHK87_044504 [Glycine soja]
MAQACANMTTFHLSYKNWIPSDASNSILTPINRTPSPRNPPVDMVPLTGKEPKGKDNHKKSSNRDHRSDLEEASSHKDVNHRCKRLKQHMLEFLPSNPLTNLSVLTNQGFFVKYFVLEPLVDQGFISEHGHQVLNKNDDVANWTNFWAFQSRAATITQHLQGFSNYERLKEELAKAEESISLFIKN